MAASLMGANDFAERVNDGFMGNLQYTVKRLGTSFAHGSENSFNPTKVRYSDSTSFPRQCLR
jgi:hypothetical protein